jgi:hypothetical protein
MSDEFVQNSAEKRKYNNKVVSNSVDRFNVYINNIVEMPR